MSDDQVMDAPADGAGQDAGGGDSGAQDAGGEWNPVGSDVFGAMSEGGDDDIIVEDARQPDAPQPEPVQEPQPQAEPQTEPQAGQQAQPQPAPQPQQQVPQQTQDVPQQQMQPVQMPQQAEGGDPYANMPPEQALESIISDMTQQLPEYVQALEADYYQNMAQMTTDEEMQAIEEALAEGDAAKMTATMMQVLSRGLALTHMNGVRAALHYTREFAPRIANTTMALNRQAEQVQNKFTEKFPQIDINAHAAEISQLAQAYRAADPNITLDALIESVGKAIVARHGLQPPQQKQKQPQQKASTAFIPADGGSVPGGPAQADDNPFAMIAESLS